MEESKPALVAKLFYLMTVMTEQATTVAGKGQAGGDEARQIALCHMLHDHGQALTILSDVACWLLEREM